MSQKGPQRLKVFERIAAGGMAEVFRGETAGIEGFKKQVAVKRVLPHLSSKRKFIRMFLDEARLSAALTHSNVVQVFDIGQGDNTYFIVMEYVDGADLKAIIEAFRKQAREFPLEAAVYIALKICEGLAYAHELTDSKGMPIGVVHRDMSPPNVMITRWGEVKIADFGLAKANNQLEQSEPGIIKGKFSYLSPEAAMGQEVDGRTDIFAVGIILWEMLAGRKLFVGESDYQTVQLVQKAQVPSLCGINAQVTAELDEVIRHALARDRDQRYTHARDLAQDLTKFLFQHGQPVGPLELAQLVDFTIKSREREKPVGVSIIDKLIQETLFEFTSLRGEGSDDGNGLNRSSSSPRPEPGFDLEAGGRATDWASEIQIKSYDERPTGRHNVLQATLPPQVFEEGNLAALEDIPAVATPLSRAGSHSSRRGHSQPPGARHPSSRPPASLAQRPATPSSPPGAVGAEPTSKPSSPPQAALVAPAASRGRFKTLITLLMMLAVLLGIGGGVLLARVLSR